MPLISGPWSNALPHSRSTLISKVASLYGNSGDSELEAKALECLDDAIDDLNMHLWEFNKAEESGIVMTAAQSWVPLSHAVYRESAAFLVDTTSGDSGPHLKFYPWLEFQREWGKPNDEGTPLVYSYFNIHAEGKLYLAPIPDSTTATDCTLTFQYYIRIPRISELDSSASLNTPREIEQAIVYGAQKRMAIWLLGSAHPDVAAFQALETKAYADISGVDKRRPDANLRFKLKGTEGRNRLYPGNYLIIRT